MNFAATSKNTQPDGHLNRRLFCTAAGASILGILPQAHAHPTGWPNKPLRLVVGLAPGGLADVLARLVSVPLGAALGQPVVIDNRGGAGGNIAGAEVVNNGGDFHSLLVTTSTIESVNPVLFKKMSFDPKKDLKPVGLLANSDLFMFCKSTLNISNLQEFLRYARSRPEGLSYGSAGVGTTTHLAAELLKQNTGLKAVHVPYRGAMPAIQDVMAGQLDFAFGPATVLPHVKAGKLQLIAIASRKRSSIAPQAPTFVEVGAGEVFADTLFGVYAPTAMPQEYVERLNAQLNRILEQSDIISRFAEQGAKALPVKPAEYAKLVAQEERLFTDIVKSKGISAD